MGKINKEEIPNTNNASDTVIEELKNQIAEKDKELNNLKDNLNEATNKFDTLEKMIKDLQQQNQNVVESKPEKIINTVNTDTVKIGSCLIGRHFLCDNNGSEIIEFDDIGDVQSISTRLLDSVMTARNKQLFKEGLVYFIDDEWYDRYSIKKKAALNPDTIDKIYNLPINDMAKEINKLTNNGKNEKIKFSLYWAIVKNIADGKDGYNDKSKEITIGNLFKVDINNSIRQLEYAKEVGFFS